MNRITNVANHILPSNNDVIICSAKRTAICRSKRGSLRDTMPEDMLKQLFQELEERTKLDPRDVGDICIGNVLQPGAGALSSRIGQLLADYPSDVPIYTVNRQCSSGLQACANIASSIISGYIEVGIAGGVESMTNFDMQTALNPELLSDDVFEHEVARNCLLPMGKTSETVAISRDDQDQLAVQSHVKAAFAQKTGLFDNEIVRIKTKVKEKETDGSYNEKEIIVSHDDGIRDNCTFDLLSRILKDRFIYCWKFIPRTHSLMVLLLFLWHAMFRMLPLD
eukprot:GHVR01140272.1.p1 GENE.GHVR01140272.1~~GHVR01140272.1.p1  ORF type:complete len:288 (+),score=28.78 GHVR01140272.1:26-865(+)